LFQEPKGLRAKTACVEKKSHLSQPCLPRALILRGSLGQGRQGQRQTNVQERITTQKANSKTPSRVGQTKGKKKKSFSPTKRTEPRKKNVPERANLGRKQYANGQGTTKRRKG